jgi:cholesterol transport system auxiliary component
VSVRRGVLGTCAILVLGACAIGKPMPQATTYVVQAPPAAGVPLAVRRTEALRMGYVRVAAAYAGNALVYRVDDVQYVADPYNAFIAEPGAMLGNGIAEWLERAGPFSNVAQPGTARPAPYVLEATVTELYGDFRKERTPAAVLTVQFALIDQRGARPTVLHSRTIASRVDLPQALPDALVRGYGEALAQILSQLVADIGAAEPGQAAGDHPSP